MLSFRTIIEQEQFVNILFSAYREYIPYYIMGEPPFETVDELQGIKKFLLQRFIKIVKHSDDPLMKYIYFSDQLNSDKTKSLDDILLHCKEYSTQFDDYAMVQYLIAVGVDNPEVQKLYLLKAAELGSCEAALELAGDIRDLRSVGSSKASDSTLSLYKKYAHNKWRHTAINALFHYYSGDNEVNFDKSYYSKATEYAYMYRNSWWKFNYRYWGGPGNIRQTVAFLDGKDWGKPIVSLLRSPDLNYYLAYLFLFALLFAGLFFIVSSFVMFRKRKVQEIYTSPVTPKKKSYPSSKKRISVRGRKK